MGQRNGMILKSVAGDRLPAPTKAQVKERRITTPEQAYADFPTRKIHA
jgi:hypothetical protein